MFNKTLEIKTAVKSKAQYKRVTLEHSQSETQSAASFHQQKVCKTHQIWTCVYEIHRVFVILQLIDCHISVL